MLNVLMNILWNVQPVLFRKHTFLYNLSQIKTNKTISIICLVSLNMLKWIKTSAPGILYLNLKQSFLVNTSLIVYADSTVTSRLC